MATTLATLETNARALLREATAAGYTQAQINVWHNEAQRIFVQRTGVLQAVASASTVTLIRDYALPTNLIDYQSIFGVWYDQDTKLQRIGNVEFYNMAAEDPYRQGTPTHYFIEDNRLNVWPIPGSSDDANTTTLGAAIASASATTCTVADNTVFPYSSGRILIDSEIIEFRGRSGTTTLSNLRRGMESTTAATHLNAATVTEEDLRILYVRAPLTMTGSIDTEIPDSYAHTLTHYAAMMGYAKRGDVKQVQLYAAMWENELNKAVQETRDNGRNKDRYHQILPIEAVARTGFGRV